VVDLAAAGAVSLMAAMFFDVQRDIEYIDLLDDARTEASRMQVMAAVRATRAREMVEGLFDHFF
jgi:hypothetical protein